MRCVNQIYDKRQIKLLNEVVLCYIYIYISFKQIKLLNGVVLNLHVNRVWHGIAIKGKELCVESSI